MNGLRIGCCAIPEFPVALWIQERPSIAAFPLAIAEDDKESSALVICNQKARDGGVTREESDQVALESHRRAHAAWQAGRFAAEVAPVTVQTKKGPVTYAADEHIRPDASMESLSKLKATFRKDGLVTAGNTFSIDVAGADLLADADFTVDAAIAKADAAGNVGTAADSESYVVDVSVATPTVAPVNTTNPQPTLTGTFDAADTVQLSVTVNGVTYVTGDPALVLAGNTWSLDLAAAGQTLPAGATYTVAVGATDAAGNTVANASAGQFQVLAPASTAPTQNITDGTPARPNSLKSSPPITGGISCTLSSPSATRSAAATRRVVSGSL